MQLIHPLAGHTKQSLICARQNWANSDQFSNFSTPSRHPLGSVVVMWLRNEASASEESVLPASIFTLNGACAGFLVQCSWLVVDRSLWTKHLYRERQGLSYGTINKQLLKIWCSQSIAVVWIVGLITRVHFSLSIGVGLLTYVFNHRCDSSLIHLLKHCNSLLIAILNLL